MGAYIVPRCSMCLSNIQPDFLYMARRKTGTSVFIDAYCLKWDLAKKNSIIDKNYPISKNKDGLWAEITFKEVTIP